MVTKDTVYISGDSLCCVYKYIPSNNTYVLTQQVGYSGSSCGLYSGSCQFTSCWVHWL